MSLAVGSRLGHYDVTALIGEGGMGEVYQATDTKLNRQVALKILPEAFVLELIEGPTLGDRIAQGPIPVDEALPIAKQIAESLEAAREAGVIRRDLKPANIKVHEDGI